MDKIFELAANDGVQALVVMAIGLLVGFIMRLKSVKKWQLEKLVQLGQTAVLQTYETIVKAAKESNGWNDEAKASAKENAIVLFKNLAKEEGIDLLKFYAKAYLPVLIEKYVTQSKTVGKIAKRNSNA